MPIYNGYPQVFYPQQPQGQLEQLRAAQYQPQPVMMPTMQGQTAPTDSGFIWVQGEAAARGYLVANGSRVLLLDADSDTFYIKEVGQDGRPFPLRIYDYKERTSGPKASIAATQAASGEFVTRKEFDALAAKLADCCCKTQTAIQGVNYNLATQECDTRNQMQQGFCATQNTMNNNTRDIIENQNSNTRAVLDFLTNDKIATLQSENNELRRAASQDRQSAFLTTAMNAQTNQIIGTLQQKAPVPAYQVPNPNAIYYGCGTGCGSCA